MASNSQMEHAPSLEYQVGLVTGAGTPYGIGKECVRAFAAAGAAVVWACDLNIGSVPKLQEECRAAGYKTIIEARQLDVSSEAQTIAVVKEITKRYGRFDFFIANAGFTVYRSLDETMLTHYERHANVMSRGVFLAIKYGSKAMMVTSAEKNEPGGTFVVTGSVAGFGGSYSDLPYAMAKAGLIGLVKNASVQLSTSNIRVNGVAPGSTRTSIMTVSKEAEKGEYENKEDPEVLKKTSQSFFERSGIFDKSQYYYNRIQEPSELANVQLFLASSQSSSINGQMIIVDSGKSVAADGEAFTGPIPQVQPLDIS